MWFIILYNGEDEYRCGITALLELLTCLEYSMLHFDDGVWLHCCVLVAYMKCVRPGLLVLPLVPLQNSSEESREKTGWCFHFAFAHEPQLVVVFDPIRVLKVYSCALAHRCMCSEDDQRYPQRVLTSVISPVCSACTSLAHAELSELRVVLVPNRLRSDQTVMEHVGLPSHNDCSPCRCERRIFSSLSVGTGALAVDTSLSSNVPGGSRTPSSRLAASSHNGVHCDWMWLSWVAKG